MSTLAILLAELPANAPADWHAGNLLGAIGQTVLVAFYRSTGNDSPTTDANGLQVERSDQPSYPNNHYIEGRGFYHEPYHAWFPFAYNFHDPARGFFRGGTWYAEAQQKEEERRALLARQSQHRTSGSFFHAFFPGSRSHSGSTNNSYRPSSSGSSHLSSGTNPTHSAPAASSSRVTRGGFGSSSKSHSSFHFS